MSGWLPLRARTFYLERPETCVFPLMKRKSVVRGPLEGKHATGPVAVADDHLPHAIFC